MVGRKGSIDKILFDEFNFIPQNERPRFGSKELDKWLSDFQNRHGRYISPTEAMQVIKHLVPGYDI